MEFYGYNASTFDELEKSIKSDLDILYKEACELLKDRWVFMDNKKVYYDNEVVALFPDLNYYKCIFNGNSRVNINDFKKQHKDKVEFESLKWQFMTFDESKKAFNRNDNFPFKTGSCKLVYDKNMNKNSCKVAYKSSPGLRGRDISDDSTHEGAGIIIPIFRLNDRNSKKVSDIDVLKLWIKNNLIPVNTKYKNIYEKISKLNPIFEQAETSEVLNFNNIKTEFEQILQKKIEKEQLIKQETDMKKYLECDKIRANIDKYDEKMLTDINRGHWEVEKDSEFVYRNPLKDVKEFGVVGIDFGTKSTVVAYQNEKEITMPMRIGSGDYKKSSNDKQYENPTVMEFINLESFLESYNSQKGRPKTKWEDLTVSHTAFEGLLNSSSDDYYAYFSDLKQWCGNKHKNINIKDKKNKTYELKSFLNLNEDDFNPVEIYAYYLGLYINNMHRGIYLDYILSFPVTYEKEIKNQIKLSFEKGLKKSLPVEVLEDEEVMKNFSVKIGANEPAAYAVTALTEYGFDPEDDEKVFYGVFDFGGGTTDFDFGIFREANQKGEGRYDYVIEHFGASGDRYLGGENLLHLLAFEVFKDNKDSLRENEISFTMHPDCKEFLGSEILIKDSQEAMLNTKQLMEKLRPIWENHENYEVEFEKGIINLNLYKNNGQAVAGFELKVDLEKLQNILRKRIEVGVSNFFESLRIVFSNQKTSDVSKINIFLAGNSSKSEIVKELFDKYIETETTNILGLNQTKEVALSMEEDLFEIFPPLGTIDAIKKQEELEVEFDDDEIRPTGKTGVAYGLVETRSSGSIKVINHNQENDEAKFKYYVGRKKKKKFMPVLSAENSYNEWVEFIDAYEDEFEIYYTTSPKASTKTLEISETNRIKCKLDKTFEDDETFVCVRSVSPSAIEYAVVKDNEILSEVKRLDLK